MCTMCAKFIAWRLPKGKRAKSRSHSVAPSTVQCVHRRAATGARAQEHENKSALNPETGATAYARTLGLTFRRNRRHDVKYGLTSHLANYRVLRIGTYDLVF